MIELNIVNFITIGLIAAIAITATRATAKALNKTSPV